MIVSTFIAGAILTPALLIISLILVKVTSKKSYVAYFPGFLLFATGLIFLLIATLFDRIHLFGTEAGFGGWGIACLFAAIISLVITAVVDTYRQPSANA